MAEICMKGVGGVANVTMLGKAGGAYAVGMALTLTGENEVGFGESGGSPVFGVVTKVEAETFDGAVRDIVLGVQVKGFHDEVMLTATAANVPDLGAAACCNDKGEIVKMAAAPAGALARVTAVDKVAHTATILL